MKVAIVGFGMMGRQIAQVFIQHEHEVEATDSYPAALKTGLDEIENGPYGLTQLVSKEKISVEQKRLFLSRLHTSGTMEHACRDAEIVIEAAVEDLGVKQSLFRQLDQIAKPNVLLVSNTSTISIRRIAELAKNKQRILGMHFFNPAQITKLVEVVQTEHTSPQNVARTLDISKRIGKTPILTKDEPGFVANRLGLSLFIEASKMLEDNVANVEDVDTAMKLGYGHAMGPFETADLVGLDTRLRNLESLYQTTGDIKWLPPRTLREMVNQGYLGDSNRRKGSKGGYYEYYRSQR
ncbi:MAG TPA: 3-hydroxyacyl-CoA dehydrogenase family protein [Candidatus Binatus sp.]|nr:3-hydroxyacyl-CoA dehydrogenase family protein [Candidatus Binatus sp.]